MMVADVLPWLSAAVALIAVFGFFDNRRKLLIEKGAKEQSMAQLGCDISSAHDKIRKLEENAQSSRVDTAEIKKDIEYIKAGQDKTEVTLSELRDLILKLANNKC